MANNPHVHDDDDQKPTSLNYSKTAHSSKLVQQEAQEEEDIGVVVIDNYDYYDDEESFSTTGGCFCFQLFCFGERRRRSRPCRSSRDGSRNLLQQGGGDEESWWIKKGKKVREISEIVAGPKWKTFIRKLSSNNYFMNNNKYCNWGWRNKKKNHQNRYDPESYALNFDDNNYKELEDDQDVSNGAYLTSFSARFSSPLGGLGVGVGGNYNIGINTNINTTNTNITN